MPQKNLYNKVTSAEEVYKAIYSLESYIFEKDLLNEEDYSTYIKLQDKYDDAYIDAFSERCIVRIKEVLNTDKLFDCKVFFRPKKYNEKDKKVEFRPLHTALLLDQVCMVVLLSALMFDDSKGKRKLSAISRLLPANFYGNIPSTNVSEIFKPWHRQYKKYSDDTIEANKRFLESQKYKFQITLDLKKFFPSVNPALIYSYIFKKWSVNATEEDKYCLKQILIKLLYFNTDIPREFKEHYYPKDMANSKYDFNIGIAQGLPQAYFFGNICMSIIASLQNKLFDGESFYYVDDSIAFSPKEINKNHLNQLVIDINLRIKDIISAPETKNQCLNRFIYDIKDYYKIEIHSIDDKKSSVEEISPINSLVLLAAPASTLANEIRTSQDEFEDASILSKTRALLDAVKLLIEKKPKDAELKRLYRFRKHYQNKMNRLERIQLIKDIVSEKDIDRFISDSGLKSEMPKSRFFEELENGVFLFEVKSIAEQICTNYKLFEKLLDSVNTLEYACLDKEQSTVLNDSLYFTQVLTSINSHPVQQDTKYKALNESRELRAVSQHNRLSNENKIKLISEIVKKHL